MPSPSTDDPPLPAAPAPARWRVRLLGGLELDDGRQRLRKLPSRAATLLLACLALHPARAHPRETLIDRLWPDVDVETGRKRLRHTLSILKALLEPGGGAAGPTIDADRLAVRVVAGAFDSDVARFEQACRRGDTAAARALYAGELLPGYYEEWIADERQRLEALHDALDAVPPPAAAAPSPRPAEAAATPARTTLPLYLTRRFGLEAELAGLVVAIGEHRLVTVLGPGGSGKTRLAVEAARACEQGVAGASDPQRPAFDLVAFVSLVGSATRAQALDAIVAALQLAAADDELAEIAAALASRRALLVLDNVEQLVGVVDDVVARLVGTLPLLHVLATSRRPLGVDGEREFALAPLPLPEAGADRAGAAANAAVALFVDRARAVRGDFHLGPGNVEALVGLVRALEGMPLAIELAASRVRSFSPQAMLDRLRGPGRPHLDLLERSGRRGAFDPRHASMARTIEWSIGLLGDAERALLGALAVFPGAFDAAAAEDVVRGESALHGATAAIVLDALVAASLVRVVVGDDDDATARFSLYQPIREDALGRQDEATRRRGRERHRAWLGRHIATLAALAASTRLDTVRALVPDLLAALSSALEDGAPRAALELAVAWQPWADDVPLPADGLARIAAALDSDESEAGANEGANDGTGTLRATARAALAVALFVAGQPAAAERHAQGALAEAAPDDAARARCLHARAFIRWRSRREPQPALAWVDEAETLAASLSPRLRADLLVLRAGIAAGAFADHAGAERLHEQALALREAAGDVYGVMRSRYHLAAAAQTAGRHRVALERLSLLLEATRRHRHDPLASRVFNARGNARSELRDWRGAIDDYRASIRLAWALAAPFDLAYPLWNLPRALAHRRQPLRAVRIAAHATLFWRTRFGELTPGDRHDLRRLRRLALAQVNAAAYDAAWREGEAMPLGELVAASLADDPASV